MSPVPLDADLRRRRRRRSPSCGARAPGCGTTPASEYLDFLSGLAVTSLGHAHPEVAEALADQAQHPGARVQPVRHHARARGGHHPRPPPRRRVARCSSPTRAAEANECAIKLARKSGATAATSSSAPSARSTAARSPRSTPPASPQKHEAFQPLPEGFRHVAWNDLEALEAALDPTVAAVLLEPVQGEGGVNPATAEYFQGVRAPLRRAGHPVHGRRGADRPRPDRLVVRPPAARCRARRGHDGQGARQRRADRGVLGQARRGRRLRARRPRHHLRRPAPRHRRRPGRARGDGGRGRPRSRSAGGGAAHRAARTPSTASPRSGAWACSSPPSSTAHDAKAVAAGRSSRGPSSTPSRRRRCASPRPCSSPTTRSTSPSPSLPRRSA